MEDNTPQTSSSSAANGYVPVTKSTKKKRTTKKKKKTTNLKLNPIDPKADGVKELIDYTNDITEAIKEGGDKLAAVDSIAEPFVYFEKHEMPDARWVAAQPKAETVETMEIAEYFYVLSTLTSRDDRILFLRKAKSDRVLMTLFNLAYTPEMYKPVVPDAKEVASLRKSTLPWGLNPYTLRKQNRMLKYLFNVSTEGKKLTEDHKARIFYEMMESLHPTEAHILHQCLTQTLDIPGVDGKLVKAAFGASRFPHIK